MIISQSLNFIFIHMHKCAGTSVTAALEPCLGWNDILLGSTKWGVHQQQYFGHRFGLRKHSSAQMVFDVIGQDRWQSMTKLTVVRNPYGRAVSLFRFLDKTLAEACKRDGIGTHELAALRAKKSLPKKDPYSYPGTKALIDAGFPEPDYRRFLESSIFWRGPGAHPMTERLSVKTDRGQQVDMDIIMRFETLADDWQQATGAIGLKTPFIHLNSTGSYDYRRYYEDARCLDIVREKYETDFVAFDYPT